MSALGQKRTFVGMDTMSAKCQFWFCRCGDVTTSLAVNDTQSPRR